MPAFSHLKVPLDMPPMEARLTDEVPTGEGWQFEPKWDGFRCLAFRDGADAELKSKSGKPLGRYFPEIVQALLALKEDRLVLDGELILPVGEALSFAALQLRLHPAASRIARLARETPAQLMLFDCLQIGDRALHNAPLEDRRKALEAFMPKVRSERLLLSPATRDRDEAQRWYAQTGGALDGIVAKPLEALYEPGERAMTKIKKQRTADCVVGGYRLGANGGVGSLLLGLYDGAGKLNYVGFTSSFGQAEREELQALIEPLRGASPFTGNAPGGPSRWSRGKSTEWVAVRPDLIAEVIYDQVTGERFRHGTTFLRWRPDKAPTQCTIEQLEHELRPAALTIALEKAAEEPLPV
jgi:ATP-dependent DNA ligase